MPNIAVTINTAPTGGAAGQLLVKNSLADYDTAWYSPANVTGGGYTYVSQQWYDNRVVAAGNDGQVGLAAQNAYYLPYYTPTAVTIDAVGVYCNGAPAANTPVRVGVLAATGSTYQPGALLASASLTVTTAAGRFTTALAATIPAGWSFLALSPAATLSVGGTYQATALPWPNTVAGAMTTADQAAYLTTSSGGLVANPAGLPGTAAVPLVYFRVA